MRRIGLTERKEINKDVRNEATNKERSKEKKRNIIIGSIAILAVFAFLFYFFVFSPTFIMKPILSKSALASPSEISSGNINWALNEMSAYKLHSYLGEDPVIEMVITDTGRTFTTTIRNNYPTTEASIAVNPDVRFSMLSADFVTLYSASDFLAKAQELRQAGLIKVELLKDNFILSVKGYKAIYDALPGLPWQ